MTRTGLAVFRLAAILIAVVALVDPQTVASRGVPVPVDIAVIASRLDGIPEGNGAGTRGEAMQQSARAIAQAIGAGARIRRAGSGDPLPCDPRRRCVVVTDGESPIDVPADREAPLDAVHAGTPLAPNVSLVRAAVDPAVYAGAQGVVRVTLHGAGVAGRASLVRVRDRQAIVGEAEHRWTADGEQTIAVPWWPLTSAPTVLGITVEPLDIEITGGDNETIVSAVEAGVPMPVVFYEPRPSWAATFVRRAAESDPRLKVAPRTRLGPSVAVGDARLDEASLAGAPAVVVGAPESITAADADLLERYVRVRGGTLVLLPDRPLSGAIVRMVPGRWTEHLSPEKIAVGTLHASEWLSLDAADPHDRVLASAGNPARPVVVAFPSGRGQVMVSGAMDAWRYRVDGTAFDRFWRSLIVSAAVAGGAAVTVDVTPETAAKGERIEVSVRRRTFAASAPLTAGATVACGDGARQALRLWPTGDPNTLRGWFRAPGSGACRIDASVDGGRAAATAVVVPSEAAPGGQPIVTDSKSSFAALDEAARGSGGIVVEAGAEAALIQALTALAPAREPAPEHPMRSPLWILAFAACLGGEWWDRRRRGLA